VAAVARLGLRLSFWLRAQFNTESDYVTIMLPMLLQGVAGSMFFVTMSAIILSHVPPSQSALAAGLNNFVRISAGAFGTSIATTLWYSRSQTHRAQLVEQASRNGWSLEGSFWEPLRAAGASVDQVRATLERLIEAQALTLGVNDIFLGAALIDLCLILPVSLAEPVRPRGAR
jgi:DHA2 family multidrug resistance protein